MERRRELIGVAVRRSPEEEGVLHSLGEEEAGLRIRREEVHRSLGEEVGHSLGEVEAGRNLVAVVVGRMADMGCETEAARHIGQAVGNLKAAVVGHSGYWEDLLWVIVSMVLVSRGMRCSWWSTGWLLLTVVGRIPRIRHSGRRKY